MGALTKLKDYFLGTDIVEYCNQTAEEFPERAQELRRKKNLYIAFGKALPDALDLGGLVLALACHRFAIGGVTIGLAEGVRLTCNDSYLILKLNVETWRSEKICQRTDEVFKEYERIHQEMPEINSK